MIEYEDVQANTNAYRIIMKIMRTLNDKNSDSVIWKTKLLKKNIITEKQNQTSFGYRMDGAGFDKTYKVNPCVKMVPNILAIASAVIGGTLLTGGVGNVIGSLFGVLITGVIQTFISFQGTLSSWWVRICIALLLCFFILLQSIFTAFTRKRQH